MNKSQVEIGQTGGIPCGGQIVLPSDQAYFIDVYAVNGVSTEFTLKLTIK